MNEKRLVLIISVLFFIGVTLIGFGLFQNKTQDLLYKIQLTPEKGKILTTTSLGEKKYILSHDRFQKGQRVVTEDISTVLIRIWPYHIQIRFLENSEFTFFEEGNRLIIKIYRGEFEFIEGSEIKNIFIEDKEGNRQSLESVVTLESQNDYLSKKDDSDELMNLNSREIEFAYEKLRPQLLRCYGQWVHSQLTFLKVPIQIVFKIIYQKTGIKSVKILSHQELPESLYNCLEQTIKEFRIIKYKGPEIQLELPLVLE